MAAQRDRKAGRAGRVDGRHDVDPPLSDEELSRIPARRGVMALLGPGGETVLLTTAADIRSPVRTRRRARSDVEG